LGSLYNSKEEKLVHGVSLWEEKTIDAFKTASHHVSTFVVGQSKAKIFKPKVG
jgi:hypothetical protein